MLESHIAATDGEQVVAVAVISAKIRRMRLLRRILFQRFSGVSQ